MIERIGPDDYADAVVSFYLTFAPPPSVTFLVIPETILSVFQKLSVKHLTSL